MKRWMVVGFASALMLLSFAVAVAAEAEGEDEGTTFKWFGGVRFRPEYNDNLADVFSGQDDKIGYASYRVNFGFNVDLDKGVSVLVDAQAVGTWGESETFVRGDQTFDTNWEKYGIYRAYVEAKDVFDSSVTLRAGRQPIVIADEWLLGDLDFYGGTSWDGIRADIAGKHGTYNLFWAKGAEHDNWLYYYGPPDESGDFDLYGAWGAWKLTERQTLEAGIIYWFDHRSISGIPDGDGSVEYIDSPYRDKRFTYALHYSFAGEKGPFVKGNVAIQRGAIYDDVDIDAEAFELTGGWVWQPKGKDNKLWARAASYSGDDAGTSEAEAFNPLAMDFHGRYGLLDFWNGFWGFQTFLGGDPGLQVFQVGFDSDTISNMKVGMYAQTLRTAEHVSPDFHLRDLGQEFGIWATYDYGKNLSLTLGVAQLFPGSAFTGIPPFFGQSSVRRIYVNSVARF